MIKNFGRKRPRIDGSVFVSENAYVIGDVSIGRNSSIWPGAILRADRFRIQIGCNCSIQDNCVIHAGIADVIIGNNVTVGHGSVIHCTRIGNNVLIGMNTTLGRRE
jgi:carbonic anhydrase/acetyltransferase-like protein (isoleucine patch superfamily)